MVLSMLRFDLRRAPFSRLSDADLYRECLAMSRWADGHGFGNITISEHHGVDFISAPTTLAGLILGATEQLHVMAGAVTVPLHDPVRLAEQVATLDLASGGRFTFVAGLGYRAEEFAMAGVERTRRGAITDEHLRVLLDAWTGEAFTWQGRTIVVTPVPASAPRELLWIGGSTAASARRAARLGLPFYTMSTDPELDRIYQAACDEAGGTAAFLFPLGPSFVHVAEDPDEAWAKLGDYARYDATTYRSWQDAGQRANAVALDDLTIEGLRTSGQWEVVTPEGCAELVRANGAVPLHPLMGGMAPELGWSSLELYVDRVLPLLAG